MNRRAFLQKKVYLLQIRIQSMNQGQGSPRKNLWKSINHERVKYSVIEPTSTIPVLSNSKQSNHNSQPLRNLHQAMKQSSGYDQNFLQSKFQSASKEVEYDVEQQDNEYGKQSSTKFYLNTKPVLHENIDPKQKNVKNRKFSIGEQSIVEQIVDLKNGNNLDICDFEEDQQPMIMSLGSQSNPAIRQLKLSKMKDEIQKLQVIRKQFLEQVKQQKLKCQQFFEDNFHKTINYLLQHYYNKIEQSQQENDRVDSDRNYFVSPISLKNHLFHDEDTPRFPKRILDKSNSKLEQSEVIEQKVEEIQRLEQQLFKIKLQNQDLLEKVERLQNQNKKVEEENHRFQLQIQIFQESQFDFDQKVAQIQIEVKQKVQKMVEQRLLQAKLNEEKNLQKKYMASMNEKQTVIQELDSIVEQVAKRQQKMRQKQRQFKEKQKNFNEQFLQFNSEKLDFQIKLEKFQTKQTEFKSLLSALQHKQLQLALREKQFNYKLNENQRVHESILKGNPNHKKTQSGQQKYYGDELQEDQPDFKIYNIKNRSKIYDPNYAYRDLQLNYPNQSQNPNPNINLNLNLNNIGRFKQTQTKINSTYEVLQLGKNWKFNHFQRENQHESIKSLKGSGSNEKKKNNSITKPSMISPTHNYSMNRSFAVNPKTNMSSNNSTFTQGKTYMQNRGHTSSLYNKSQDKNRLEDLGSKLQNLRNQIRKQIHDMD